MDPGVEEESTVTGEEAISKEVGSGAESLLLIRIK